MNRSDIEHKVIDAVRENHGGANPVRFPVIERHIIDHAVSMGWQVDSTVLRNEVKAACVRLSKFGSLSRVAGGFMLPTQSDSYIPF